MEDKLIFTKITPDGRDVSIRVHDYGGTAAAHLYLAGAYIEGPSLPTPLPRSMVRGNLTHYLGGGLPTNRKIAVGFTRAEAQEIRAAIVAERQPTPSPRRVHAAQVAAAAAQATQAAAAAAQAAQLAASPEPEGAIKS